MLNEALYITPIVPQTNPAIFRVRACLVLSYLILSDTWGQQPPSTGGRQQPRSQRSGTSSQQDSLFQLSAVVYIASPSLNHSRHQLRYIVNIASQRLSTLRRNLVLPGDCPQWQPWLPWLFTTKLWISSPVPSRTTRVTSGC